MLDSTRVTAICAFDIGKDDVVAVNDRWPTPTGAGEGFRWLHFDLAQQGLGDWAGEHLPDIAARALLQSETRPRCERLDDGLILNLRGVNLSPDASPEDMVSLRMWLAPGMIVSARARKVFAADAMRQFAESGTVPRTQGGFVAELVHGLTRRVEAVSLEFEDIVDGHEEAMLPGQSPLSEEIGRYRQATIKLRRFVSPQREALDILACEGADLLGKRACQLIRESANRTRRILEELDAARDRLTAIQDHADAQQAHALARNSYLLSVVAAIFLPLGFLTGLFGANVAGMPGTSSPMAFWLLAIATVVLGALVFLLLKVSRWL